MHSDTVTGERCTKCGGNIIFRQDEKSYCYNSCLQCGKTRELGHARSTGYVPERSEIIGKMNSHPDGLLGSLFN